jgi:SAM-dependent methyltransferase
MNMRLIYLLSYHAEMLMLRICWGPYVKAMTFLFSKDLSWKREGFVFKPEGPILEVGGPTDKYDICKNIVLKLDELKKRGQQVYISNVCGVSNNRDRPASIGVLDLLADGTSLPVADGALGAVFVSCMNRDVRDEIIVEASRVLRPGGILVWQGAVVEDISFARSAGLEVVSHSWQIANYALRVLERYCSDWLTMPPEKISSTLQRVRPRSKGWFMGKINNLFHDDRKPDAPYCVVFQK